MERDKKYEASYQRKDYTQDPSYQPLQVADRTGETQRVINSRERQETLNRQSTDIYQKSYLDRIKRDGDNQVAQAKELTQLGKLSQSLAGELTKLETARGEAAALDEEQKRYEQGLSPSEMMSFDDKEAELAAEGAAIDTASFQLGEETQDPSIERAGRKLSGWRAYGAKRAEARLRGENYGPALDEAKTKFQIQNPYDPKVDILKFQTPAPASKEKYQTFCGT